ncbi:hypothetical protein AB0H43_12415 [Hamadaea sp. NPDC050747]|uniref:hypothetical protein n=1 Tax=Hamadaea sp. NPDC050747 TaxID=3155789 RepID=UPI00340D7F4E
MHREYPPPPRPATRGASIGAFTTTGVADVFDFHERYFASLLDGEFYQELARGTSQTVEYGLGNGRIARTVRPRYGVEQSVPLAQMARSRLGIATTVIIGDVRTVSLPQAVAYSYWPGTRLNRLTSPHDLTSALGNMRRNSAVGGTLAFDAAGASYYQYVSSQMGREFLFPLTSRSRLRGSYFRRSGDPDVFAGTLAIDHLDVAGSVCYSQSLSAVEERYYSDEAIRASAEATDWRIVKTFGSFDHEPMQATSSTRIFICEAV